MRVETVISSNRPVRKIYGAGTTRGRQLLGRVEKLPQGTLFCVSESEMGIQVCVRHGRYDDAFPFIDNPWFARCYHYRTPDSDGEIKLYNRTGLHRYEPFTECDEFEDELPFTVVAYDGKGHLLEKYTMNMTRGVFFAERVLELAERWGLDLPEHDVSDPEILHLSVDYRDGRPTSVSYYLGDPRPERGQSAQLLTRI